MSSFKAEVRHKETGEIKTCFFIDDYFDEHEYGFLIQDGDKSISAVMDANEFDKNWERVLKPIEAP